MWRTALQVLPFLLRRMKEDVLADLPPKIVQDYYCELSDVQHFLYEELHKSQALAKMGIDDSIHSHFRDGGQCDRTAMARRRCTGSRRCTICASCAATPPWCWDQATRWFVTA